MVKYTQRQLKDMVFYGNAWDISDSTQSDYYSIMKEEGYLTKIGYSCGTYGCNGLLFQGHNTGRLYAITKRTTAIFIFG